MSGEAGLIPRRVLFGNPEDAGPRLSPDGTRLGWVEWFLRLQTTPGSTSSLAEALARRPDTRWVQLASAGTEIICTLEARTPEQRDALLLHGLPGSRRVVSPPMGSTLITSAPRSARMRPALGPMMAWQNSSTRMPARGGAPLADIPGATFIAAM